MNTDTAYTVAKKLVHALMTVKKYPEALMLADALVDKFANDHELHFLRGQVKNASGSSLRQVENDLRQAIKLKPNQANYHLELANVLLNRNQYDEAITEFKRAQHIAPNDPQIKSNLRELVSHNGTLSKTLRLHEKLFEKKPNDSNLVDRLVSLYVANALKNWHTQRVDNGIKYFASRTQQLEHAAAQLQKIKALPLSTNYAKKHKEKLAKLIQISKDRRFDGFISDWLTSFFVIIIGFSTGGFMGCLYAINAVLLNSALRKPNYISNRQFVKQTAANNAIDTYADYFYGNWLIDKSYRLNKFISDPVYSSLACKILRSIFRAALLPLSVAAAFYKNYSWQVAVITTSSTVALSYMLADIFV